MCMFPACCFRQGIYVIQGQMNGAPNETQTHSCWFVSWMFLSFCIGLHRGHCCLLYLISSSSSLRLKNLVCPTIYSSCWTLLKPQHSNPNPNPLALLLPHLSSSLTDSLSSLNLLFHSKTDAQFMQDGRKAVWSIPYVSVAFFPTFKHNFIAYNSSKVSSRLDCNFEIHQL